MAKLNLTTDEKKIVLGVPTLMLEANNQAKFRRISREVTASGLRISFDDPRPWKDCRLFLLEWEERELAPGAEIFKGAVYMVHNHGATDEVEVYVQEGK